MKREVFADGLFEREPPVLNGIEVGGVWREEFAGTAGSFDELLSLGRVVKGSIVVQYNLPRLEHGHQTVLDIGLKERRRAVPFKNKGSNQRSLVQGVNNTDPLGAVARLLSPTWLPPQTPAVSQRFMIVDPGLIHIDQLRERRLGQFRADLLPQRFVAFGIPKGLFLCV